MLVIGRIVIVVIATVIIRRIVIGWVVISTTTIIIGRIIVTGAATAIPSITTAIIAGCSAAIALTIRHIGLVQIGAIAAQFAYIRRDPDIAFKQVPQIAGMARKDKITVIQKAIIYYAVARTGAAA